MASIETTHKGIEPEPKKRRATEIIAGTSAIEGVAGAAAVVLAILALVGVLPVTMTAIATIVLGLALLIEGAGFTSQYSTLVSEVDERAGAAEMAGGMTVQFIGGVTGTALGILALIGIAPITLMAVAAVVFGASLLLGAGSTAQLNSLTIARSSMYRPLDSEMDTREVARQAVSAAAGTQVLVGLGGAILGILALAGVAPTIHLTLIAVAMLGFGASVLFNGAAVSGKMAAMVRH